MTETSFNKVNNFVKYSFKLAASCPTSYRGQKARERWFSVNFSHLVTLLEGVETGLTLECTCDLRGLWEETPPCWQRLSFQRRTRSWFQLQWHLTKPEKLLQWLERTTSFCSKSFATMLCSNFLRSRCETSSKKRTKLQREARPVLERGNLFTCGW